MNKWIGRHPWFFPFPTTIIVTIMTLAVGVLVHQLQPGAYVVSAVILIITGVFAIIASLHFSHKVYTLYMPTTKRIYGFIDGYVSTIFAISNFTMAAIIVSAPGAIFNGIPPGVGGYDLYWTYIFSNIVFMFNSAGRGNAGGATAWGVLLTSMASIIGYYFLAYLAVVLNNIRLPRKKRV